MSLELPFSLPALDFPVDRAPQSDHYPPCRHVGCLPWRVAFSFGWSPPTVIAVVATGITRKIAALIRGRRLWLSFLASRRRPALTTASNVLLGVRATDPDRLLAQPRCGSSPISPSWRLAPIVEVFLENSPFIVNLYLVVPVWLDFSERTRLVISDFGAMCYSFSLVLTPFEVIFGSLGFS